MRGPFRGIFALAAACGATTAFAIDPACVDGTPVRPLVPSSLLDEQLVARDSAWDTRGFTISALDGSGNRVRNADLSFDVPDGAPSGRFSNGERHIVINTGPACAVVVPGIVADSALGTFVMRAQVANGVTLPVGIPFRVVAPPSSIQGMSVGQFSSGDRMIAGRGKPFARVEVSYGMYDWSRGQFFGYGKIPITFTVPASGPSAIFDGGATSVTVATDPGGRAPMPALISNGVLGRFPLTMTAPGAPPFTLDLYNVGPTLTTADFSGLPASLPFPAPISYLTGRVTFEGYPCLPANATGVPVSISVRIDGAVVAGAKLTTDLTTGRSQNGCDAQGNYQRGFMADSILLSPGQHEVRVAYDGDDAFEGSEAPGSATLTVTSQAAGSTATGGMAWRAGVMPHDYLFTDVLYCRALSVVPRNDLPSSASFTFPLGGFAYEIGDCGTVAASSHRQRIVVDFDHDLPPDAIALSYGKAAADTVGTWQRIPSSVSGNRLQFVVDDVPAGAAGGLAGLVGIAVPQPGRAAGNEQDLWWGGAAQNGWGLGIAQHDDRLFATLFAYGTDGAPRWWVVPGGTWSADFATFSGSIYSPRMPLGQPLVTGDPVGTMTLAFHDATHATMKYTIDGIGGERAIERQPIARPDASIRWLFGDLWWRGAALSGTGYSITQQGNQLFIVEYVYDALGNPVWDVMPGGRWIAHDVFDSARYSTTASGWLSGFDPSSLRVRRSTSPATLTFSSHDKATLDLGGFVTPDDWGEILIPIQRQPF